MTTLAWVAVLIAPTLIAVAVLALLYRFAPRPRIYTVPRAKEGDRIVWAYADGLVDPHDFDGVPGVAIPVLGDPRELIAPLVVVETAERRVV